MIAIPAHSVKVKYHSNRGPDAPNYQEQSIHCQLVGHSFTHRPTNYQAREEINDNLMALQTNLLDVEARLRPLTVVKG